jgi:6-pyruvoyltetrahydropterin/6-carboxytetrahydropterin synthase
MQMTITKRYTFEAAHFLPNVPEGHKCKRMHGHNYEVEITILGPVDERSGWIIDFFQLDQVALPLIANLDHRCLNEIVGLENPTAERIAHYFSHWLGERLYRVWPARFADPSIEYAPSQLAVVSSVRVFETKDCWATFTR